MAEEGRRRDVVRSRPDDGGGAVRAWRWICEFVNDAPSMSFRSDGTKGIVTMNATIILETELVMPRGVDHKILIGGVWVVPLVK